MFVNLVLCRVHCVCVGADVPFTETVPSHGRGRDVYLRERTSSPDTHPSRLPTRDTFHGVRPGPTVQVSPESMTTPDAQRHPPRWWGRGTVCRRGLTHGLLTSGSGQRQDQLFRGRRVGLTGGGRSLTRTHKEKRQRSPRTPVAPLGTPTVGPHVGSTTKSSHSRSPVDAIDQPMNNVDGQGPGPGSV